MNRHPLRLVGSSFGGWAAAQYAQIHRSRVDRLLLLCPGFELGTLWENIVGPQAYAAWHRDGVREFALPASGEPVQIPWRFVEATRQLEGTPVRQL